MKKIGIVLIVVGLLMTARTSYNYVTREIVADLGSVQINRTVSRPITWSPVAGGVVLLAGLLAFLVGKRKSSSSFSA
jgi:hypothetical protein